MCGGGHRGACVCGGAVNECVCYWIMCVTVPVCVCVFRKMEGIYNKA